MKGVRKVKYDFCGYVTKNDVRCADGRTIRHNAFLENDGGFVPLVWQHQHDSPDNVIGKIYLENRDDGVYGYGSFNKTAKALNAKELVRHGDITSMSIYANRLQQQGGDVLHGLIREVSLVIAGANPYAVIDNPVIAHSGDYDYNEAVIRFGTDNSRIVNENGDLEFEDEEMYHSDEDSEEEEEMAKGSGKTVQEIYDSMTPEQQQVCAFMIGMALQDAGVVDEDDEDVAHDDLDDEEYEEYDEDADDEEYEEDGDEDEYEEYDEDDADDEYEDEDESDEDEYEDYDDEEIAHGDIGGYDMKHNIFDEVYEEGEVLSHAEEEDIFDEAIGGETSLRSTVLAHGIENIDYLMPDAKAVSEGLEWYKREDAWVAKVMQGVHRTPFSRIKSMYANLTENDARAKGWLATRKQIASGGPHEGSSPVAKVEEFFSVLKRTTTPTTVYKKQALDKDDIDDITDFNIVGLLKTEMRMMLDEEIARAILIGDGRSTSSDEKINEQNIRPIWTDDDTYTIKQAVTVTSAATEDELAREFIKQAVKARKNYKGSGDPTLFCNEDILTDCLLIEDLNGRVIYDSINKLATALRVKEIVSVPVMNNQTRSVEGVTHTLLGIIVNLNDYNVGADKGGAVNMFDDFDIDFNKQKFLIETRCSGAMVRPYSAIALEKIVSAD